MKLIITLVSAIILPATVLAAVGDKCRNNWGHDCICLDKGVCRNRYGGTPYTGTPGNWPCPADPDNVMACVVAPCPKVGGFSQCLWRPGCFSVNKGMFKMHSLEKGSTLRVEE